MGKSNRARRWPTVANRHRTNAIMEAAEIEKVLQKAKVTLRSNPDLCLAYISNAQTKAQLIKMTLENAPGAEENGAGDG